MNTAWAAALALLGFAANSLLCRAAIGGGAIDPQAFTLLRMVFGPGTGFTEPVHIATQNLKNALDAAGYPH